MAAVIMGRLLIAVAALYLVAYVVVAILRMAYPFELEFVEGAMLTGVERVAAGQPLYAAPSLDYVALNYPPLYFGVGALLTKLLGPGFLPLRLISFLSSLGVFVLIFEMVRRETGSRGSGLLAAGLFAACFTISGAWYDVARADSLWLALLLAGFAALRWGAARGWGAPLAGALFALSFLTKQTTAVVIAPMLALVLVTDRRRFLALAGTLAAALGATHLWLNAATGGWYSFYVFRVALAHPVALTSLMGFWTGDIAAPVAIALLAGGFFLMTRGATPDAPRGFYGIMAAGMVLCAWWLRLYPGGFTNVLMPAYAALAILFGLGWHELKAAVATTRPALRTRLTVFVDAALLLQFAILAYNPGRFLPTPADQAAGEEFLRRLQSVRGDVIVPRHGYLLERIGRAPGFHEMPLMDVLKGRQRDVADRLLTQLREAIHAHRYATIVIDNRDWLDGELNRDYVTQSLVFENDQVCWPKTGMRTRPSIVMVPRTP